VNARELLAELVEAASGGVADYVSPHDLSACDDKRRESKRYLDAIEAARAFLATAPVHEGTDAELTDAEIERRVGRESDELDRVEEMSDNDVLAMVGYRMTGPQLRRMGRMVLAAARGVPGEGQHG
jgi:hypothetical protein